MKKILTLLFALVLCIGANAAQLNLADVINKALTEQKPANGYYAVLLDSNNEYVLNSQINLGQNKVSIWGSAIVKVEGDGQIATQTYFTVNGVSFDLADAKKAPLALEAVTKETLPEVYTKDNYPGAGQDMPHYDYKYSIFNCNFANVKNGVFYDNGTWAIQTLEIKNCIINIADDMSKIVFENMGGIQNLDMSGNTIYMVGQNKKKNVIKFLNASNAQPQKVWGNDAKAYYFVTDNTFCNLIQNFGDQCPNKNNIICTVKGNIFYNTQKFQNKLVGNGTKNYTANDNIQFCNSETNTIESGLGIEKDPGFKAPVALDLNNPAALKACFATDLAAGSPAWCKTAFYTKVNKTEGQNYEALRVASMIKASTKNGGADVIINSEAYPWVKYVDLGSDGNGNYDDFGNYEVTKTGGCYSSIDLITGEPTLGKEYTTVWGNVVKNFEYVTATTDNWGAPKINADYKSMEFNVANVTKVRFVLSGGAGRADNSARIVVLNALTGDTIQNVVSEDMNHKSQSASASKTDSKTVTVEGLDSTVKYIVKVLRNVGDVNVYAIHLWGEDLSVAKSYHVKGANYESEKGKANYEVISTQDFLAATKMPKRDKPTEYGFALREDCSWVEYINETSLLLYGGYEVSAGNRMTSVDLFTAEPTDNPEMLPGTDGTWLGGYPTIETTKKLIIRLDNTSESFEPLNVRFIFTGAGSNANKAKVLIQNEYMDDDFETENMPGKSQKANQTNSCVVERMLFAPGKYTITVSAVEGASALCALHITNDWDFEYSPANELGETNGIENVETVKPVSRVAYNIAGQRVANNAKGLIIVNGNKYINK